AGLDVVLCDPFDGRDIAGRLERIPTLGPAKVLVFTWSDHPRRRRRALEAGADGFLTKNASTRELLAAVEAVLRGDPVPVTSGSGEDVQVFPGLSQRESEVLVLIGRGLSNQEIADRIYVSVNSVKTYIRQIYAKTGATRRTQAVAWAHEHGWDG
ncbi:MAG: response regulator transcription factor, partial [Actinomycetota bacterium]|nr:response regulator transcription factor [Actinomycetota bacterium]